MATFSFFSQDMAIVLSFFSPKRPLLDSPGFFFLASMRNFAKKEKNTDHILQQYEIIRYYYSTI
jgi:hypothetical protein